MVIESKFYIDSDAGIYFFKNTVNNKYYIGQAINIKRRICSHISNYRANRYDTPLYRAFNKYGIEHFELGILKRFDKNIFNLKSILDFWERYYIILYNAYGSTGYNQTFGGDAGILGFKMSKKQRENISKNSKLVANDGRNIIYCYNIETKETIQCPSLVSLSSYLGIKLSTSSIYNTLINDKYIIARTIKKLKEKILKYEKLKTSQIKDGRTSDGKFAKKITEEALKDIILGMSQKEWVLKYNLCKASYSQYKRKLIKRGDLVYTRVYSKKVEKDIFIEYMNSHTAKEASEHFNVNISRIYKYKKLYNI